MYRQIEFVYDIDDPKKSYEALRFLENSDSIEIYLNEIEAGFIEGLETLEQEVDVDNTITEEEKLELISSISLAIEVLPTITDEFSVLFTEDISDVTDARFFRRVGNFIKKVVNGAATVVGNIINGLAYISVAAQVISGSSNLGGAFITAFGGIAGFLDGVVAVFTNGFSGGPYVCLFCIYNETGNPCCCADPDTAAACPV
jgi:hypothetical protein